MLTGKRVTLAEELSELTSYFSHNYFPKQFYLSTVRVRQIQEKLEEFINSLNTEK